MSKKHIPNAYGKSGVDVTIEAQASRIMYEAARETFRNRKGRIGEVIVPFDDFSGLRVIDVGKLPQGSVACLCFDGAGTKVEIAERVYKYDTIAFDVLAMVCDDAVVRGGEPVLVGTNLDIRTLGTDEKFLPKMRELAKGYVAAAKAANVAIINGEIAQMGSLIGGYGDFPFHWGASLLWFGAKKRLFTGREIKVGDAVVLLQEKGFRANGLSLVRKIFKEAYGEDWHKTHFGKKTLGEAVLTPSVIYSRVLVEAHGGFAKKGTTLVHGVAHITGGGLREKLGRILKPSGFGVRLDDVFEPPEITKECQKIGKITDADAYSTWNMGQGMAVFTPQPKRLISIAKKYGVLAKQGGVVVKESGVEIVSRGVEKPGKLIRFGTR